VPDKGNRVTHVALVVLYWFVLLGLLGEESTPKDRNSTLGPLILVVIAFGIWRVVRKRRRRSGSGVVAGRASVAAAATPQVTPTHYQRLLGDPPTSHVILPSQRRQRVEDITEPMSNQDLVADSALPLASSERMSSRVTPPEPTRLKPWWRRVVRIPVWVTFPLLWLGSFFVIYFPIGIDWYGYGYALLIAVVTGVWAKRRYRVTILHRENKGAVYWIRWGKAQETETPPVVVVPEATVQSDAIT
jgi:hypothetical protein